MITFKSTVILFLIVIQSGLVQAEDVPLEYRIKSNYLLNIPLFVEFQSLEQNISSFTICVVGDTPIASILSESKGKQIKKRPVVISRIHDISQLGKCQVVFIASSEQYRLQKLLTAANRLGILTISDMRGFVKQGGMINLLIVNGRVTFDLNQTAANNASISFGTQLLKLANDVTN